MNWKRRIPAARERPLYGTFHSGRLRSHHEKYTIPPIPKPGTIVQYHDERGVTLKKLVRRKNPETGKMEYTLHPINPAFGDIEPMDGGKISALYVETLDRWEKV